LEYGAATMAERYHAELETPIGPISFAVDGYGALVELAFGESRRASGRCPPRCQAAFDQLAEYFAGKRIRFELAVKPAGTDFQRRVWNALTEIPYGEVVSYADIARRIGKPGAARAVGQANGANPIPIVIPCHRVIAADGSIGGFSSGLSIKRMLLALEQVELAA
jgi:methylated-DNA-[protein]-cysteine S-methyltransferase